MRSDMSKGDRRTTPLDANLSDLHRALLYDRPGVYAASKRQLSRKETKRLGFR